MHEKIYEPYKKVLDPLIGGCERIWVECKDDKFLLFACSDREQDWTLTKKFWSIGSSIRRAARVRKAKGHHLPEHLRMLWEIQEGRCYFSGAVLGDSYEERKFSVDHLFPLASHPPPYWTPAGTHWPINLALVTAFVNRGKGGRTPAEYLREVKEHKTFVPIAAKERRRIDQLRRLRFGNFMREHCSENEDDWGPP